MKFTSNKNDNIHKTKFKKPDDQRNGDKYRVAANITEYHVIFMKIRQVFHVKMSKSTSLI